MPMDALRQAEPDARPADSPRLPGRWLAAILVAAGLVRLPLALAPGGVTGGDGPLYFSLAQGLLDGEGFGDGESFRTPGYPVFLVLVKVLPGSWSDGAVATQHVLGVLLVAAVALLTARWFGVLAGVIAGGLAALSPALPALETTTYPDLLFAAAAFATAAALVRSASDSRRVWPVLAGIAIAIAVYVKPAGQALILAVPVALLLVGLPIRAALARSVPAVGIALLLLAPWVVRNAVQDEGFRVSNQAGLTLFHRAFDVDRLQMPLDRPYGELIERDRARTPDAAPRYASSYLTLTEDAGLSASEAIAAQGRLAKTAIRREPSRYVAKSATRLVATYADIARAPFRDRNAEYFPDRLESGPLGGTQPVLRVLFLALRGLSVVLLLLAPLGLLALLSGRVTLSSEGRAAASVMIVVWLALALSTVLVHGGTWRYSASLAPLTLSIGAGGVMALLAAVRESRRAPARGGGVAPAP